MAVLQTAVLYILGSKQQLYVADQAVRCNENNVVCHHTTHFIICQDTIIKTNTLEH